LRKVFAKRVRETLGPMVDKLRFVDESGVHLGLTRLYGRTTPEKRVVEGTPGTSGPHYTVVADLELDGVRAPWFLEGAMTGAAFETYVEHILAPTLKPGEIVLMDNLSVHKGAPVRTAIEARGASLEYLPPYSPDWNPIEKCWSKIKAALRKAKPRTRDELLDALADALGSVSPHDAADWFTHCGYPVKP
jgi:transposase